MIIIGWNQDKSQKWRRKWHRIGGSETIDHSNGTCMHFYLQTLFIITSLSYIYAACDGIMWSDLRFTTPFHIKYDAGQVYWLNACYLRSIFFYLMSMHDARPQQLRVTLKNKRDKIKGRCEVSGSDETHKDFFTFTLTCAFHIPGICSRKYPSSDIIDYS